MNICRCVAVVFACSLLLAGLPEAAQLDVVYGQVKPFADLPEGIRNPEGLAVNPVSGEVYVGTFDLRSPATLRNNQLLRYSADGKLLAQRNATQSVLYINNAGDGRVLRMPIPSGPVSILAESVYGADGLLFHDGYLWVASNQSDAMVALDEQGRVRARIGQFLGIDANGSPRGLLFPSGGAVQGKRMIVANLAFPLTATTGDEWEEEVTRWNLVSFEIPQLPMQ
ncbi:hypothetical protein [Pseudomonas fluorescens]|uniref:SMP-30/Gluconolactonase/LRE-like region domain-containing protein n=1 Tax=Pseudomonas fluorescens TaxID=294 RepID=A0A944DH86_PSEFL|nr:hypothetical protein [Pseudomonas fluorescens]MBT2298128.1 hypothetical protein [Pseudomonas fluorescens]MBT2309749.1 hypothetical protein [Pseudomonas fluorescens]MBT2314912.1 hypothetical protein [Pseudomonas fluorescens]MBT2327818.1 hypothetical protein [Pseudomonas fluorescens]MBT2345565.1 hypothetical protein [Pseudomonas fluorescens]